MDAPSREEPNVETESKETLPPDTGELVTATACQWVASPEGKRVVAKRLERARTMAAEFQQAQQIDPSILNKPVTL
jgi:hypothetical protein